MFYNYYVLVIYSSLGCPACRKVKTYLKENEVNFIEKNIFKVLLNKNELGYLISHLENGIDDLVYTDSKLIKELDIKNMENSKLLDFIQNNPSVVKTPIILNEDITHIKNNKLNLNELIDKCDKSCAHYETCGAIKE